MTGPTYVVADALTWLEEHQDVGSIVTGPPDPAEIDLDPDAYPAWLEHAAGLCLTATSPTAVTIFAMTDRKVDGGLLSKAHVLMRTAAKLEHRLLWHKLALRRDAGKVDLFRPTYTPLLAFSREATSGRATPDVIPPSKPIYANGIGVRAALALVRFAAQHSDHLVDPFCGRGTLPALAAAEGLTATGIDLDPDQIELARRLEVRPTNAANATPVEGSA
jgi:hypothetical protein